MQIQMFTAGFRASIGDERPVSNGQGGCLT